MIMCYLLNPARQNLGAANKYLYKLYNTQRKHIALSATADVAIDVFTCLNNLIIFELQALGELDPFLL